MEEEQLPSSNPVPATDLLPLEDWEGIFSQLNSASDATTILNCREVCSEFKTEVDGVKMMTNWMKPPELDPLPKDETPVPRLGATKIYSRQSMTKFQTRNKTQGGNPFPTRSLSFHPKPCPCKLRRYCRRCVPDFEKAYVGFAQFSKRFGKHVDGLQFTVLNQGAMGQLRKSVFKNFPNVRQLEVKIMFSPGVSWKPYPQSFNWLQNFNFPPLAHLTHLSLKMNFGNANAERGIMITKMIKAYGRQLTSLTVSISYNSTAGFEMVSPDDLPNLMNLKLQFCSEREPMHVLNFLKNGNWPLKQLTIFQWGDNTHEFNDVLDIIFKFASTLEILHLSYYYHCNFVSELVRLSEQGQVTQEELENAVQISRKLPRVKELSLPYGCIKDGALATSKFCDKFENLETLHVYDCYFLHCDPARAPNYEEELNANWWPVLSPESKLECVIILRGTLFHGNCVVHKVINKPV